MKKTNNQPRFWHSSFCYLVGSVLSKIAVFLMLPLYTARIPSEDMGIYDTAVALAILVSSVLFLDLGVGLMRFLLQGNDGEENTARVLSSGAFVMLCSGIVYGLVCSVIACLLDVPYYPLIVLYGLLNAVMMTLGHVARAEGYHAFFALAGAASTLVQVGINFLLILGGGIGYQSLYIAFCIGTSISILMVVLRCRLWRVCKWRFVSRKECRRLLSFCLPLGLNSAAFWLLNSLNRVLVTVCLGSEANGYYAVALKFTQILILVSTCFQYAWQELSFAKGFNDDEESCRYYSEKTDLFLRVFMAALLLSIPAIRLLLAVFPNFIHASYEPVIGLLPLAFFGAFLSVLGSFLDPVFGAAEKTVTIFLSTVIGAAVNVAVILLLFRFGVGVSAANIAFLCGWTTTVGIRLAILYREARLKIRFFHLLWFLPLAAFVVLAFFRLSFGWNLVILGLTFCIAIVVLLPELRVMFRRFFRKTEKV